MESTNAPPTFVLCEMFKDRPLQFYGNRKSLHNQSEHRNDKQNKYHSSAVSMSENASPSPKKSSHTEHGHHPKG